MEHDRIRKDFDELTDKPAAIRAWIQPTNEDRRGEASLESRNEFNLPSGRHNAERVLKLKEKKHAEWSNDDVEFAGRVVNYAKRSAGIAEHHPHAEKSEVGDTGMTKNEIARKNWGLPARP